MHSIHTISLISLALGCNSITYGMQTAPRSFQKFSRSCSYIETAKSVDTQQGRRDAYQQWCPTPINWDKTHNSVNKEPDLSSKKPFEDKKAFCKQCGKQQ